MLWWVGIACAFAGLLWVGSGVFGASADPEQRSYVMSRGGAVVAGGLALMFAGTVFTDHADMVRMAVNVIVGLLLAGLIIAHLSQREG